MDANHKNLHTDLVDAICCLYDIVGDLNEAGKTSETRLAGLQNAVNKLLTNIGNGHASDCAVHNAPAYPSGECDCQ